MAVGQGWALQISEKRRVLLEVTNLIPYRFGSIRRMTSLGLGVRPYLTLRKLTNLLRCEAEKLRRVVRPASFPLTAVVDVNSRCNLQCPYCPTGARRDSGRTQSLIDPSIVQRLVDEIGQYLISAHLFNWGEPLLHPQIAAMVNMFHRGRIFTAISSNLNVGRKQVLEELCDAGLDHLAVSISGVSQEIYEQYHRTGKLALVLDNTRHIIEYKKRNHIRNPVVEWKFLAFSHNLQEVESARKLAREVGVDVFRWVHGGGPDEARVQGKADAGHHISEKFCHQLWHSVILQSDGGIAPCCYLFFKQDDLGEYSGDLIEEIRQNEAFTTARALFDAGSADDLPTDLQHPCLRCGVVHEQPHLSNYLKSNPHAIKGHRTGGP
jgi:organic radical activating enzyme